MKNKRAIEAYFRILDLTSSSSLRTKFSFIDVYLSRDFGTNTGGILFYTDFAVNHGLEIAFLSWISKVGFSGYFSILASNFSFFIRIEIAFLSGFRFEIEFWLKMDKKRIWHMIRKMRWSEKKSGFIFSPDKSPVKLIIRKSGKKANPSPWFTLFTAKSG